MPSKFLLNSTVLKKIKQVSYDERLDLDTDSGIKQEKQQDIGNAEVKMLAPEVKKSKTEESKETKLFSLIGIPIFSKSTKNYSRNSI